MGGTSTGADVGGGRAEGAGAQDEDAFAVQPGRRGVVVAADGDLGAGLVEADPPGGQGVEPFLADLHDLVAEFGQLAVDVGGDGAAGEFVGEVGQVPGHQVGPAGAVAAGPPGGGAQQQVDRGEGVRCAVRAGLLGGSAQAAVVVGCHADETEDHACGDPAAGEGGDERPGGVGVFEGQVVCGDHGRGEEHLGGVGELGCGAGIGEGGRPRLAEGEPADHVTALITDAMQEGRAQPRLVVLGGRRVAADDEQTVRVVAHRVGWVQRLTGRIQFPGRGGPEPVQQARDEPVHAVGRVPLGRRGAVQAREMSPDDVRGPGEAAVPGVHQRDLEGEVRRDVERDGLLAAQPQPALGAGQTGAAHADARLHEARGGLGGCRVHMGEEDPAAS